MRIDYKKRGNRKKVDVAKAKQTWIVTLSVLLFVIMGSFIFNGLITGRYASGELVEYEQNLNIFTDSDYINNLTLLSYPEEFELRSVSLSGSYETIDGSAKVYLETETGDRFLIIDTDSITAQSKESIRGITGYVVSEGGSDSSSSDSSSSDSSSSDSGSSDSSSSDSDSSKESSSSDSGSDSSSSSTASSEESNSDKKNSDKKESDDKSEKKSSDTTSVGSSDKKSKDSSESSSKSEDSSKDDNSDSVSTSTEQVSKSSESVDSSTLTDVISDSAKETETAFDETTDETKAKEETNTDSVDKKTSTSESIEQIPVIEEPIVPDLDNTVNTVISDTKSKTVSEIEQNINGETVISETPLENPLAEIISEPVLIEVPLVEDVIADDNTSTKIDPENKTDEQVSLVVDNNSIIEDLQFENISEETMKTNDTLIENITLRIDNVTLIENITLSENLSLLNETLNNTINTTLNLTLENITLVKLDFSKICLDSCLLPKGINSTNYKIVIETKGDISLKLDTLHYSAVNLTLPPIGIIFDVTDENKKSIQGIVSILNSNLTDINTTDLIYVKPNVYDVLITLDNYTLNSLEFKSLELFDESTNLIALDNTFTGPNITKSYALDPNIIYDSVTINTSSEGDALYRCSSWNFKKQDCNGNFEFVKTLVTGSSYEINTGYGNYAFIETVGTNATNISYHKIKEDPKYELIIDSVDNSTGDLIVIFHHNYDESLPIFVKGDVNYSLSKDIAKGSEEITLTVYGWNENRFRILAGSHTEAFEFGIPRKIKFKGTIKDADKNSKDVNVEFIDSLTDRVTDKKQKDEIDKDIDEGEYNILLTLEDSPVKTIEFKDVSLYSDVEQDFLIDDVAETGNLSSYVEVYAIDPTNLNFSNATLKAIAKGNVLYKCADWNFTEKSCPPPKITCTGETKDARICTQSGGWVKVMTLSPDNEYSLTLTPVDPAFAEYNSTYTAPYCGNSAESPCYIDSSILQCSDNQASPGPEPNQPNTIDACSDSTTSGTCHSDESVENITITSLNDTTFKAGDTVEVTYTVYCWGTADRVALYYANSTLSPDWRRITSGNPVCSGGGIYESFTETFVLDDSIGTHAVRAINKYNSAIASACDGAQYTDYDDTVFEVLSKNTAPSTPTQITCDGGNCNNTFYNDVDINCSGSVDTDSDLITYFIDATLRGQNRILDGTDKNLILSGGGVPVVESYTSNTAVPGSSLTLTKPSGVVSGDLLLLIVGNDDNTNTAQWSNTLSGWTLINEAGTSTSDAHVAAYRRIADGTEGATVSVPAQSSDDYWGYYIRITGVNAVSPINAIGSDVNGGNTASRVISGVTTTVANTLAFFAFSFDGADGDPFSVTGTGWSKSDEIQAGTGAANAGGTWGTKSQPTAGATGTVTVGSSSSDGSSGFQFAVAGISSYNNVDTSSIEYQDFAYNYSAMNNLTITVEVDTYYPGASISQGTSKPDLYLNIYDGSTWSSIGAFNLPSTYTGSGFDTTNHNFSLTTSNPTILSAWQNKLNQDFRIKGINFDYYNNLLDEINYTNVWVTFDGKGWIELGSHDDNSIYNWDFSSLAPLSNVDLRCKAIDLDGTNTSSGYYAPGVNLTLDTAAPDTTPPASVTNLINSSATPDSIYWTWTNPLDGDFLESIVKIDGENTINISSPINYYNKTGLESDTEYTITINTKDTAGNINYTDVSNTGRTDKNALLINLSTYDESSINFTYNIISESQNIYDIELSVFGEDVETIYLYGLNSSGNTEIIFQSETNELWGDETFAVAAPGMIFDSMNLTLTAVGTHLLKCEDWNMASLTCNDLEGWDTVSIVNPGQKYNLTINSTDPGFVELTVPNQDIIYDGYADEAAPALEYGARNQLFIQNSTNAEKLALIMYDLTILPKDVIIDDATLRVRCTSESLEGGESIEVGAHNVYSTFDWIEGTGGNAGNACGGDELCWNNKPLTSQYNLTSESTNVIPDNCAGTFYQFNITSAVYDSYKNAQTNGTIMLKSTGINVGSVDADSVRFNSKEAAAARRPYINITYHTIPKVTPISPNASSYPELSKVQILVNASDNPLVANISKVVAQITYPNTTVENYTLTLTEIIDYYEYNFTNTQLTGQYNISIIANNTDGYINNTETDYFIITPVNKSPSVDSILLNSTFGTNYTFEDLTVYTEYSDPENDSVRLIYDWRVNDTPISLYNIPFEGHDGNESIETEDYSGVNIDLDVKGAIWNSTGGYDAKGAYYFDGTGDYIEDPMGGNQLNGLSALTLSVWVKSSVTGVDNGIIYTHVPDGTDSGISLRYDVSGANGGGTNVIKAAVSVEGVDQQIESSNNIQTTEWQNIVFVWNSGEQLKLYINGILDTPTANDAPQTGNLTSTTRFIMGVGAKDTLNVSGWNGFIDEVKLYRRALSPEQIMMIYENRSDIIVSNETQVSDIWSVEVTPNDGMHDGNVSRSNNLTIIEFVDTPPTVSLDTPVDNSTLFDNNITFTCNASDLQGLLNISLYTNITGTFEQNNSSLISGTNNYSEWLITDIPNGNYIWNCLAYDTFGQYSFADDNYSFNVLYFEPELVNPNVTNLATDEILYAVNDSALIFATVLDDSIIDTVIVNITSPLGANYLLPTEYDSILMRYIIYFNETSELGTYYVQIIANDTFGNVNDSEDTTFKIVQADLTGYKFDYPDPVEIGETITYDINISAALVSGIVPLTFSNINYLTNSSTFKDSPQMIETNSGTLLIVYNENTLDTMDNGNHDIYILRSVDRGKNWTKIKVTDEPQHDIFPNIYEDNAGRILIVYSHLVGSASIWAESDVWIVNSSDDGLTWNEPYSIIANSTFIEREPVIAQKSNGVYYIAYEGEDGEIYLHNSNNFYTGWSDRVQATNNTYGDVDIEIHIINDTFYFAWAPFDPLNSSDQDIYFAKTTDPMVFNFLDDNKVPLSDGPFRAYETSIGSDASGNLYIAWSSATDLGENELGYDEQYDRTSNELYFARSFDGGDTWGIRQSTDNNISDGYPGVVQSGNGLYYLSSLRGNPSFGSMDIAFGERDYSPQDAVNITIIDYVPEGITVESIGQGGVLIGDTIIWTFDVLYAGQELYVSYSGKVNTSIPSGTYLENNANITYYDSKYRFIETINVSEETLVIDSLNPSVYILSPLGGDYNISSNISIVVNVTDNGNVDTVLANVSWDSTSEIVELVYNVTSMLYEYLWTNTTELGPYYITIIANDTFGNTNETEETVFYITNSITSIPTSITCNGGNCNDTFTNSVNIECSGSVDPENDSIIYTIEAYYNKTRTLDINYFTAGFESTTDGFTYQDDLYGTSSPAQAQGSRVTSSDCPNGSCLNVNLNLATPISGGPFSGGWNGSFTVYEYPTVVNITYTYKLRLDDLTEQTDCMRIYHRNVTNNALINPVTFCGVAGVDTLDEISTGKVSYVESLEPGSYKFDVGCYLGTTDETGENADCWIDDINFIGEETTVQDYAWGEIGNHTEGNFYAWSLTNKFPQENVSFRCKAIDNGSNSYTDYYSPNINTNITYTPPVNTSINYIKAEIINKTGGNVVNLTYYETSPSLGSYIDSGTNPDSILRIWSENASYLKSPNEEDPVNGNVIGYFPVVSYSDKEQSNFLILQDTLKIMGSGGPGNNYTIQTNGTHYYRDTDITWSSSKAEYPGFLYATVSVDNSLIESSDIFLYINPYESGWLLGGQGTKSAYNVSTECCFYSGHYVTSSSDPALCADDPDTQSSSGVLWNFAGCTAQTGTFCVNDSTLTACAITTIDGYENAAKDSFNLTIVNGTAQVNVTVNNAYYPNFDFSSYDEIVEDKNFLVIEARDSNDNFLDSEISSLDNLVTLNTGAYTGIVTIYVNAIPIDEIFVSSGLNPPEISLISPADSSILNDTNVTFLFNSTDDFNVTNCSLYINSSGSFEINQTIFDENISEGTELNKFNLSLTDGNYLWNVLCFDNDSLFSFAESNFTFKISTTPEIELNITNISITPDDDPFTEGFQINPVEDSNVTISVFANITNNTELDSCEVIIYNETDTIYTIPGSIDGTNIPAICNASFDFAYYLPPGDWNITVNVNTTSGSYYSENSSFYYNILRANAVNTTTITFTGVPDNLVNSLEAYPLLIRNTGNVKVNISILGDDFIGLNDSGYMIGVDNATYNESSTGIFTTLEKTNKDIYELDILEERELYFRGFIPVGTPVQEYRANVSIRSD